MLKSWAILPALVFVLSFSAGPSFASTQTVSANISFQSALTSTSVQNIDVGVVLAGTTGTYTLDTKGNVVASNGGQILGGTPEAGVITIAGSDTQSINISVENYQSDSGVTPSKASCSYESALSTPCSLNAVSAPGAGTSLLLGVTLDVDGTQAEGTQASPSFDVVISYT